MDFRSTILSSVGNYLMTRMNFDVNTLRQALNPRGLSKDSLPVNES